MAAARVSWGGPAFFSTIRQDTPCRLSSAAMNRPTGPAPTTNTWVSVAIRYPFVLQLCRSPIMTGRQQKAMLVGAHQRIKFHAGPAGWSGDLSGRVTLRMEEPSQGWRLVMGCCDETTARVPDTAVSRRSLFKGAGLIATAFSAGQDAPGHRPGQAS